jgi:hypothetical protein
MFHHVPDRVRAGLAELGVGAERASPATRVCVRGTAQPRNRVTSSTRWGAAVRASLPRHRLPPPRDGDQKKDALASIADERGESSFHDLARYLDSKGVHTLAVQTTPSQLPSLQCMCVLQVRVASTSGAEAGSHFVVFVPGGVNGHSYVLDPIASGALSPARMDLLVNKWTGKALLVSQFPISPTGISPSNDRKPILDYIWAFCGLAAGGALGVVSCRMIGPRPPVCGSSSATPREFSRSVTK